MKSGLGVGAADTIDTLDEETSFQVVDEGHDEDTNWTARPRRFNHSVRPQVLRDAIELRAFGHSPSRSR